MSTRFGRWLELAQREGPVRALLLLRHRAAAARWERELGVETAGDHLLADEGLADPERHDHSASSVLDLQRVLQRTAPRPEHGVFLDLGSGKGRAVLVAAQRPFRRVIGVEFSPHLTAVARRNLDRARPHLRCGSVELVTGPAEEYAVPEDVSLIYLYNPFRGSVMARVCDSLHRSLVASPREVTVVVATPRHFEAAVAGQDWIRPRGVFRGLRLHAIHECRPRVAATAGSH